MDGLYYIALRYVGIQGVPIDAISKIQYPFVRQSFTYQPGLDEEEEEKSSLINNSSEASEA